MPANFVSKISHVIAPQGQFDAQIASITTMFAHYFAIDEMLRIRQAVAGVGLDEWAEKCMHLPNGGKFGVSAVRTGTTVEGLVRALADDMVSGRLSPGARLDETSIATRYEVSRTPVREALARLSAMGLIDRPPNRGAVVATVSDDRLHSMFEAMVELEAICARLSAERMTTAERHQLDAVHRAAAQLVYLGAEDDYARHNVDFHTRLYVGAHNAHIQELVGLTRSRLAPFRRAQFRLPGRLSKSWDEHDAIVTAILRGDASGTEAAARAHVSIVSDASAEFMHGTRREVGIGAAADADGK